MAGEALVGEESALLSSFESLGVGIFLATLDVLPVRGVVPTVRRLADLDLAGLWDGRPFFLVTDDVLFGEALLPFPGLPGVAFSCVLLSPFETLFWLDRAVELAAGLRGFPADDRLAILDLVRLCDDRLFTPRTGEVLVGEAPVVLTGVALWAALSSLGVPFGLGSTFSSRLELDGLPAEERLPTLDLAEPCDGRLFTLVVGEALVGEGPALLPRLEEAGVALF